MMLVGVEVVREVSLLGKRGESEAGGQRPTGCEECAQH